MKGHTTWGTRWTLDSRSSQVPSIDHMIGQFGGRGSGVALGWQPFAQLGGCVTVLVYSVERTCTLHNADRSTYERVGSREDPEPRRVFQVFRSSTTLPRGNLKVLGTVLRNSSFQDIFTSDSW